jgi:hypothetical protein
MAQLIKACCVHTGCLVYDKSAKLRDQWVPITSVVHSVDRVLINTLRFTIVKHPDDGVVVTGFER